MKQWTTDGILPNQQFDFWRETICQSFVPLRPERKSGSHNGAFHGELIAWQAAGLAFARVSGDGQFVYRDPDAITDKDQALYFLNFQQRGHAVLNQVGKTATLAPGAFALLDATQPFHMEVSRDFEQLSIKIPHSVFKPLLRQSSSSLAQSVGNDNAFGRLAMKALIALADEGDLRTDTFSVVAVEHALQLTALALIGTTANHGKKQFDKTGKTLDALRLKAIPLMQAELDEGDFSVAEIAQKLNVSVRYLQAAFTQSNISIREWVLEQRLTRCRADLLARSVLTNTISSIAYSHGFNDLSYFNRAFKARYGCAPSRFLN